MKKIVILITSTIILITSCKKEHKIEEFKSGYFILSELKREDLKSVISENSDSIKTSFMLGDIKASKEFYFILSNGGNSPISDIEIISDNESFQIIPNIISSLAGKGSKSNDFIPLLSLNVIHGIRLNGVGFTTLLPMNKSEAKITVIGNTAKDGNSIHLKSVFSFTVNAKVMDVRVFANDSEINLTDPKSSVMFSKSYGGLSTIRYYQISSNNLKIVNTGNVNISVQTYKNMSSGIETKSEYFDLIPSQSNTMKLTDGLTLFELDSDGTITDDSRIQLGSDGKGYFAILLNS